MQLETLEALRADFETRSKGSLSLPIAGVVVWSVVAVLGAVLTPKAAVLALVFATGAIFPVALAVAKARSEHLTESANPLARLMGICVLMVNLLWALHVPLLLSAPHFVPLSLGIGLGLHWMVYSWIIGHPLGYRHAIARTLGLVAVWFAFPEHRVSACAVVVVLAYLVTLAEMRSRLVANNSSKPTPLRSAA
jgi:predicted neutral ceramidase superfamily lipid hydrolase